MIPKYFDAHTHLNIQFDTDWQKTGQRALDAGVAFVNVGADVERSKLAVEQAKYFGANGYATVGIHPTEDGADFATIEKLAEEDCVVAIGECGLELMENEKNTHQNFSAKNLSGQETQNDNEKLKSFEYNKKIQEELFRRHIELALKLDKPLMIHCREAYEDTWEILNEYRQKVGEKLKFNMHFFAGDWAIAQKFLALGGYLSFTGVITFTDQYDEVIKKMPLDRLMAETDAPFVAPVPYRGKRNEPAYVVLVADRIAELRSESREEVLEALIGNTRRFFGIN
ncbi:MAG: TatD family hydrolase [Candidatus Paceibacterota bacterium]|jgi:TatD DNase family protein